MGLNPILVSTEDWLSGLKHFLAKEEIPFGIRRFESCVLRHFIRDNLSLLNYHNFTGASVSNLFNHIYKDKLPKRLDLKVLLFYTCNMGCEFCIQDRESKIGMSPEEVISKADIAIESIDASKDDYVNMTVFGGEMFGDFVPDDVFDAYFIFFKKVNDACKKKNMKLIITNFNNLYYRKAERVKNLLQKSQEEGIEIRFGISYDLLGRFSNPAQTKLFKENEKYLEDYIVKYNTILTKEAIQVLLRPEGINDPYFDYLYGKYEFGTRHYWKNDVIARGDVDHTAWQHASEQDIYDAYIYLFEHYPQGDFVQNFIECIKKERVIKSDCPGDRNVVLPDNSTVYCINNPDCETGCVGMSYLDMRGCLSCEYFKYCRVDCFHEEQDPNIEKLDVCVYKQIYKEYERRLELKAGA